MSNVATFDNAAFDAVENRHAPTIVFVHGSVVTRKIWLPQLCGLADDYHLIAPDLPGHGASAAMPFTFANAVQMLADLIQQEASGRALVAGLSLGGYVAIELAYTHPELVAGLVLSGCSLNFTGLLGLYLKLVAGLMQRGWLRQSQAQAIAKTKRLFPPALAEVATAQLQAGVYPAALGPSFAEMAGKDFASRLGAFAGPTLLLNGANDSASRRGAAKFLVALQQGRLETIANAGHACNLDQPVAYNQALRAFAQTINWRSTSFHLAQPSSAVPLPLSSMPA